MHADQYCWRALADALLDQDERPVHDGLLMPWLRANPQEPAWLAEFARRAADGVPHASMEDLWRLFAMSVVFETLALGLQPGREHGTGWHGPTISREEFVDFAGRVGFDAALPERYTPFHFEICGLDTVGDPSAGIEVVRTDWPCLMLGSMLFMRAGATARAPAHRLRPGIADTSHLYWAYRRKARPVRNLSQDWGSHSRWRTPFRRDYLIAGVCHFNVDGRVDLAKAGFARDENMTLAQCVELVTNRSFAVSDLPHDDRFPYNDRVSIPLQGML